MAALKVFFAATLIAALCSVAATLAVEKEKLNEDRYVGFKELKQTLNEIKEIEEVQEIEEEPEPMQLLSPSVGHERLELNEMTLDKLRSIEDQIAIVSIVGPYHGGKSFLMNVLLNSTHGFAVGSRAEPETRGIWIRIMPKRKLQGADGSQVILMDTEGFYGEGATRLYDAKIFALATLLGSHLVYNTLRTLGDAQSVSSLADLSKHAQVFNLQNWLHTAASEEEYKVSADIDTSVLLRTIDFPPLTWVVQGFNIDLQTSEKPMDHLQRYIAAHAHAGDSTLDILFSRGISCYTLRTPADLNSLREKYGSKGLAADVDLFNKLHPKYHEDIQSLHVAIFGNLTAKGENKFTGKRVAALLPLLVHYVNEDFPLHAERKLRDVLADIITDGAFAGGVQYFEKEMKDALSRPEKMGFSGKKLRSSEDLDIIAGFAKSAFTSDELSKVLDLAEKEAINYCYHRSVGVPSIRAKQNCEASLTIKLNRMKPLYRDQNDIQVREILIRLGDILHQKAEKILFDIKLPVPENEIRENCSRVLYDVLKRYEDLVGPHQGSCLYDEAYRRMHEQISAKCDQVFHINVAKVQAILNSGKGEYEATYNNVFFESVKIYKNEHENFEKNEIFRNSKVENKPLPPKVLAEVHASGLEAAQQAFEKAVKAQQLSWIGSGNQLYDFTQFQCLQWSKQRFNELQLQNQAEIVGFCRSLVSDITFHYKQELSKITPFPDNDEVISSKADGVSKMLWGQYATVTNEYAIPDVDENGKELIQNIEEAKTHLIKKNTVLMAAYCYEPLQKAYKELHMEECERTINNIFVTMSILSIKCLWWGPYYTYGFKYVAYKTARKYLEQAQLSASHDSDVSSSSNGIVLSPVTQNKVIQAWIERDLAKHVNVVLVNFSFVITFVLISATTCYSMKRKTKAMQQFHVPKR